MSAILLIPAPGDPYGLLKSPRFTRKPGDDVSGGGPPIHRCEVPLPAGLVPSGEPCSGCHTAAGWPSPRNCDGACTIRGDGSLCARANLPNLTGTRVALILAWDGKSVPECLFRAWGHADDAGAEVLADLLDTDLAFLAADVAVFRRNGQPLGEVVILAKGSL